MSGPNKDNSPFLHLLPVKTGESITAFQNRLLLSLSDENPLQIPVPISPCPSPSLSPSKDKSQKNTVPTEDLQQCLISSNCIALLTKQGRAGRIKLEVFEDSSGLSPVPSPEADWTPQDEELANQLRPQLQAPNPSLFQHNPLPPVHQPFGFGTQPMQSMFINQINQPLRFGPPIPPSSLTNQTFPFSSNFNSLTNVLGNNLPQPIDTSSETQTRDCKEGGDLDRLLVLSEIEWTPPNQLFTSITVVTSEILLLSQGQLFSWSLESDAAVPHPRTADLQLSGEEIVSLSAATIRVSVATLSGKVATFYDTSITRHTDSIPGTNLIATLSHPLIPVGLAPGDRVASLSVSDTASYLLSSAGCLFWWGYLSSDKKQKTPHSSDPITVDSLVSLRDSSPCPPGGLLLNLSTPYRPLLATLCRSEDASSADIKARLLEGEGREVSWKKSETLYLESRPDILGRVIAVDKDQVVINTQAHDSSSTLNPDAIKIYSIQKLRTASECEDRLDRGIEERDSIRAHLGLIQIQPTCVLDCNERSESTGVITGFRCISLTSHSEGPLLLLERLCDNNIFLLNSSDCVDKNSNSFVFSGSVKHKLNWNNATCADECIPGSTSGLLATTLSNSTAKFVTSRYPNAQILLDRNGYIRPIQSFYRLRPPFYQLHNAFESISISSLVIKNKEYIVLLCMGKKKELIRAIEQRDVGLFEDLSNQYLDRCVNDVSVQVKRPKISSETTKTQSEVKLLKLEEANFFLEESNGNRNILHTCIQSIECSDSASHTCSSDIPSSVKFDKTYLSNSFEEVRWNKCSGLTIDNKQKSSSNPILSYFLSHPALTQVTNHLLCGRDVSGNTPFMLSLKQQDHTSATLILDYVENMSSLSQQSRLYESAICQSCYDNQLLIQALLFNSALSYCQFGLKTMLIQPNTTVQLTQVSTRSMLVYIQTRYPSAYRCEAYNVSRPNEVTVLSQPFLRTSIEYLKSLCEREKNPLFKNQRISLKFLVAFSDVREMREAIRALDSTQIAGPSITQQTFNFIIQTSQYYGQSLFDDTWKNTVRDSFSTPSDEKIECELQRVCLVERLLELTSTELQVSQESILSSILCDQLLVEYLEDMHNISDRKYKFKFGQSCTNTPGIQTSAFGTGGLFGVQTPVANNEPLLEDKGEEIEETDSKATENKPVVIGSILHILTNSWPLVASAIQHSPAGDISQTDYLLLSIIDGAPVSVVKTILQVVMNKIDQLPLDPFIQTFLNSKAVVNLEEEDIYVITVVKKFIQSLVRLYNKAIVRDKYFEFSNQPTQDTPTATSAQQSVSEIRHRIFSVLCSFKSLAVRELLIAAQGLTAPIIAGNLKHYQCIGTLDQLNSNMPDREARNVFRCQSVRQISHSSEQLPTLPQAGLQLVCPDVAVSEQLEVNSEKKNRSDYWGQEMSEIASSSSDSGNDSEEMESQPVAVVIQEGNESEVDFEEDEDNAVNTEQVVTAVPYGPVRTRVSWFLDGLENTLPRFQPQNNVHMYHGQTQNTLSTLNGGILLARTFSRLLKTALKLLLPLPDDVDMDSQYTDLPCLNLSPATHSHILNTLPELVDPVFQWAAKLLDLAENQLETGKRFRLESRYSHTLPPGDIFDAINGPLRNNSYTPLSQYGDYTNYLICLNEGEASSMLPVIDIQSYEHVAFILDAQVYFATYWNKCSNLHTPNAPDQDIHTVTPADSNFFLRQSSLIVSKHKQQQPTEPDFKIPLKLDIPLAQKPHLLNPEISKTTLFSTPTPISSKGSTPDQLLNTPTVFSSTQLQNIPVCQLSSQEIMSRWKNVIQAFVDVFTSSGPTSEPENFLFVRAGFAGKKSRFYNLIASHSTSNFGYMQLQINRSELLKDSLSKLFTLVVIQRGSLNVSFEGEPGGGPGVTSGFYTAFANALKSDQKLPPRTETLFHEPGKIPEQATYYAPTPTLLSKENPLLVQRLTYYRAIGKFFGLSLLCKEPIPLLLSRHVLKYILGRQVSWHDVGFFNAELYEGLRKMIVHCQEEEMTHETFHDIYMLHFEALINGNQYELKAGGKSIQVTPDNIQEYVRLYSMFLMVGSVKEELEEMKTGFRLVIPSHVTQGLTAEDLQLLLSGGSTDIPYAKLKQSTIISFLSVSDENVRSRFRKHLYKLFRRMTNKQRQQLLYFGTGSALLAGDKMTLNLTVNHIGGIEADLPTAATCSRLIQMPCYSNYAVMKSKVLSAIACDSYELA